MMAEYILLYWDGPADYEAVKGHVSDAEFERIIAFENEGWKDFDRSRYGPPLHRWARWNFAGPGTPNGCTRKLILFDEKSRGRFPVTVCQVPEVAFDSDVHVYPDGVIAEHPRVRQPHHQIRNGLRCWCEPSMTQDAGAARVILHKAVEVE